jgi:serine/threonine protein kinase
MIVTPTAAPRTGIPCVTLTNVSAAGEAPGLPAKLGRYELITQIGQGGMAEVQLALQRGPAGFEKLVVVKLVHGHLATQKTFVDMLLDEARVAALVKHPNVVDIYDLGEVEGRYFIAMEYLEGEPLLAVLRAGREGKRLDPLSTARLIADTAEGLDAAHELRSMGGDPIELVHHDVSLGNIVVLYNGQVKLVDFGVAKANMTTAGPSKIQGKFAYMAPEKLQGGAGDRRSDIWSLGVVLWEALTLRRLFKGGNDADTLKQVLEQKIPEPSAVNGDVIAELDPIVMKALEREPANRYATAKALAQDLEEVLRKQGYGGRNDQIAKYMQATFESHINARKKLLQEVSSKGRASAAVLQAAFSEPVAPSAVGKTSEFSIAFKATAEGTPARPISRGSIPIMTLGDLVPQVAAVPPTEEPAVLGSSVLEATARPKRPEPATGTTASTGSHKGLLIAIVLIALVAIGIVVAMKMSGGDDKPITNPTAPVVAPPPDAQIHTVTVDAAAIAADAEIEMPPEDAAVAVAPLPPRPAPIPPPPPKPQVNLQELTATAVREMAAGQLGAAIGTFKKVTAASPSYAAAWRGLGIAYEKQGAKPQAVTAFQRYLAIAPAASDAAAIRERLERLKK